MLQYVDRNVGPADYQHLGDEELLVTKVFYTIQAEGPLVGTPSVFIRLAGCDKGDKLSCPNCDTNFLYDEGSVRSVSDLVLSVITHIKNTDEATTPLVVITGGEPMLQNNIVRLIGALYAAGFRVQIESNGDRLPPGFLESGACDKAILVVSPKVLPKSQQYRQLPEDVLTRADYLKFIVDADPASPYHDVPLYATEWCRGIKCSESLFISPWTVYSRATGPGEVASIWEDDLIDRERTRANMAHAVSLCLKHGFTLSLQTHLITGVE